MKFYSQTDPEGLWKKVWIGVDLDELQYIGNGGKINNTFCGEDQVTLSISIGPEDSLEKLMENHYAASKGKVTEDDLV